MIAILKDVVFLVLILLAAAFSICIVWFCWAMLENFWKIFIKKKPSKKCFHASTSYHADPYNFWKCNDCGEVFPE